MDNIKKLFRVDVECSFYVAAEDARSAERIAISTDYQTSMDSADFYAQLCNKVSSINSQWKNIVPFGECDNRTCQEIVEEYLETKPVDDPNQIKFSFFSATQNFALNKL